MGRPTSGSFPLQRPTLSCPGRARGQKGRVTPCCPGAALGSGPAASGVCKFDLLSGFGLQPCPSWSLRLISPSRPTAGLQMGFLRIGLLWVLAPGHKCLHGSSPRERRSLPVGARTGEPGFVDAWVPSRRSPGLLGKEQSQDPPLVDACTLPAAEVLGTDVHQAPPAGSYKPPFLDRPPARFLTICAATYRTNQWLCGRSKAALPSPHLRGRFVPYLRPRRVPAASDPLQNVLSGRRAQSCPVLGEPGRRSTHRGTDQLGPNFNLRPTHFCPYPRLTDLTSHLSLLSPPILAPFSKDSFNLKSAPPLGPTDISPFPILCGQQSLLPWDPLTAALE